AGSVLILDRAGLAGDALLPGGSFGGGVGGLAGGEGLGKDVADLIGPSAVMLDDGVNDMAHGAFLSLRRLVRSRWSADPNAPSGGAGAVLQWPPCGRARAA